MAYKVEKFKLFNLDVEVWHYTYKGPVTYFFDEKWKCVKVEE